MSAVFTTPTVTVFEPPSGGPIDNLNEYYGGGNTPADMIVATAANGVMLGIKSHNRYGDQPSFCTPTLDSNGRYVFHVEAGQYYGSTHWPATKWSYDFVYDLSTVGLNGAALYGLRTRLDFNPAAAYPSASEWYQVERYGYVNDGGGSGLEVTGGNSLTLGYCNIELSDGSYIQDGVNIHVTGSENNPGFVGYAAGDCTGTCLTICGTNPYTNIDGFNADTLGRYEFEHEIFELANPNKVIVAVGMSVVTHGTIPTCPTLSPTQSPTTSPPTDSPTTSSPTPASAAKSVKTPKAVLQPASAVSSASQTSSLVAVVAGALVVVVAGIIISVRRRRSAVVVVERKSLSATPLTRRGGHLRTHHGDD